MRRGPLEPWDETGTNSAVSLRVPEDCLHTNGEETPTNPGMAQGAPKGQLQCHPSDAVPLRRISRSGILVVLVEATARGQSGEFQIGYGLLTIVFYSLFQNL